MFQQKHHILASLITSFSYSVTQSLGNYLRGLKKICGHKPVLLNRSLQQHSTITLWCSGVAAILQSGTRTPLQCGFHKTAIMATMVPLHRSHHSFQTEMWDSTTFAPCIPLSHYPHSCRNRHHVFRQSCGTTQLFTPSTIVPLTPLT